MQAGADVPAKTTNTTAESKSPVCPKCGAQMVMRVAKQGPKKGKNFWGCSGFPTCREPGPWRDRESHPKLSLKLNRYRS